MPPTVHIVWLQITKLRKNPHCRKTKVGISSLLVKQSNSRTFESLTFWTFNRNGLSPSICVASVLAICSLNDQFFYHYELNYVRFVSLLYDVSFTGTSDGLKNKSLIHIWMLEGFNDSHHLRFSCQIQSQSFYPLHSNFIHHAKLFFWNL